MHAEILDAAEELLAEHGPRAPLADIAKRAGVAVGTLYNYFTDRDALVAALFESRRATLRPMIAEAVRASGTLPFEPRLRSLVRDLLAAFDSHRRYLKVLIVTEHLKLAPPANASDVHKAIEDVMRAGAAEGAIDPERAELASFMLSGAIKSVVLRRTAEGVPFSPDAEPMVAMFLAGVRA